MHFQHCISRLSRRIPPMRTFSRLYSGSSDTFYSGKTYGEVIENKELSELLSQSNFDQLSLSQALAYPPLSRGKSVVLAAETGSGKTLAYLVPLIESVLKVRVEAAAAEGEGLEADDAAPDAAANDLFDDKDVDDDVGESSRFRGQEALLVLCPNAMLCEQVAKVVHDLFLPVGIKCAYVSSQNVTYDDSREGFPDVIVTTPVALHSLMTGVGPIIGPEWTFNGLREWARYIVLDEADMLLGGAYGRKIEHLMDELRAGDRERAAKRACQELGIEVDAYWSMPRHIRKAAQLHGGKGMLEAGAQDHVKLSLQDGKLHDSKVWLRQYAFVAATMPREGRETVGAKIAADFPNLEWISGGQLHKTIRNVDFRWLDVGQNEQVDALARVIEEDLGDGVVGAQTASRGPSGQKPRIIVFTKNTASSKAVTSRLEGSFEDADLSIVSYHKGMTQQDRADALQALRNEERPIVLVCTDATARGLDVPGVSHVIHADFPASAVDFLHRSGRTGRAGARGMVTSLVQPESVDLAEAIKELMDDNDSMEGAFSRNRSFRKKHKKYGRFVKRGEVG
jgi:superfamily II DNA/RNA helicase